MVSTLRRTFNKVHRSVVLSLLAASAQAQAIQSADNPLFDMSLDQLLDIDVVGVVKKPQSSSETPASVSVLTREDIALLGFNTLQRSLEYVVGFNSVSGENNIWHGYSIRGNTPVNYNTDTLLLVDGIRVYNPLFGTFDLSAIPLSSVERVEVIKGSRSVLYGTNAVNAVINIVTRAGNDKDAGEVTLRGGELDTRFGSVAVNTAVNDEWNLGVFVDRFLTDNETIEMGSERGELIGYNRFQEQTAALLKIQRGGLELTAQYHDRELPTLLTRNFSQYRLTEVKGLNLGLQYTHSFNENWQGFLQLSRYTWEADREFFARLEGANPNQLSVADFDTQGNRQIFYDSRLSDAIGELSWKVSDKAQLNFGVNISEIYGRRFQSRLNAFDIGQFKDETREWSLYANGEYRLTSALTGYFGVRHYEADYHFTVDQSDNRFDNTSVDAALVWQVDQGSYWKLVFGQSFRIPTYFEKEANTQSTVGNPDLFPEDSESIDLIYTQNNASYQWDITLFRSSVEEKIGRVTAPDGRRQNQNLGTSDLYGLETNLRFRLLGKDLYGFATLGLYDGEGRETMDRSEDDLAFTFDHAFTLGLNYQWLPGLNLTASVKDMGEWGEAAGYTMVNTGLRYDVNADLRLTIDAHNLFNQQVRLPEVSRGNPNLTTFPLESERNWQFGLVYRL